MLTWKKAQDMVPWNIILLLGGGFAMAKGCEVRAAPVPPQAREQAEPAAQAPRVPRISPPARWEDQRSYLTALRYCAWRCPGREGKIMLWALQGLAVSLLLPLLLLLRP